MDENSQIPPAAQPLAAAPIEAASPPPMMAPAPPPPTQVNVLNPEGSLVSIPSETLQDALSQGYQQAPQEAVEKHFLGEQYGTLPQQAITGLEGLAEGVAGPLATGAMIALGDDPKAMRARQRVNPGLKTAAEIAGLTGSFLIPGGQGELLAKAGAKAGRIAEAGFAASKIAGEAKFIPMVAGEAANGAIQAAIYQGGQELSKTFEQDPEQTAQTAIGDIGLSVIMGGVGGAIIGPALKAAGLSGLSPAEMGGSPQTFVSELDDAALQRGDFKTAIKHSAFLKEPEKEGILASLGKEKANAGEIREAGKRLGAPVMEGMVSDNKSVQAAESALIDGRVPTVPGLKRQALYNEGWNTVSGKVDEALGEGSRYTKAQLGDTLKESLTAEIDKQVAPIEALYDEVKKVTKAIPIQTGEMPKLALELKNIDEFRVAPRMPAGRLVKQVMGDLNNLQTVDDIKLYKTALRQNLSPMASMAEKRVAAIVQDRLSELESKSIERMAIAQAKVHPEGLAGGERLMNALAQRKEADKLYKPFKEKVSRLSEQLGKGKVYGAQDAINFIKDHLSAEEVASRIFSKKDSAFNTFLEKEFPREAQLIKEYQKSSLREEATKEGNLSLRTLFSKVNKLEPEIQSAIFDKAQLATLKDAETYISSIPKNFNPSNTANMSSFREYFESPVKAAVANVRDYAMTKFIKSVSASPEVRVASELGNATVRADKMALRAVKSILSPAKYALPAALAVSASSKLKLDKMVDEYHANPERMLAMGDHNPVAPYAASFAATAVRAVDYLNSVKPDTDPKSPLDAKRAPNSFEKAAYDRALTVAQQPLAVLDFMHKGTLTPSDIDALKTIYPSVYTNLSDKFMSEIIDKKSKGQTIAYPARVQLSMFLAQPMDSTLTQPGIVAAQTPAPQSQPEQPANGGGGAKHTTSSLDKLAQGAMTPLQSRQAKSLSQ